MQTLTTVRAMYPSKGVLDNGKPYDSTKVHIDTELSSDKEGFGIPSPVYNWGTSQNYHDFVAKYPQVCRGNKPFEATITWSLQTTGKTGGFVVVGIEPIIKKPAPADNLSIAPKN